MSRPRSFALVGVVLAAVVVLLTTAPVAAHLLAPPVPPVATAAAPGPEPTPTPAAIEVPEAPPVSPWLVGGALLVLAAAVAARRRPRTVLIVALALVLAVFAFENALHSVHHGFDVKQSRECPIAAASAHLAAVAVDVVVESSVILVVAERTAEPQRSPVAIRLLGPDQDRAPPIPSV
jgi:hypothetical protein